MAQMNRIWKMYLLFSFVVILVMALAGFALQVQLKAKLTAHLEDEVLTLARVLAKALPDTDDPDVLTAWCSDYSKATGARITLIAVKGSVIVDSTEERIAGVHHLDRPEVFKALELGSATAVRFSETSVSDMFYAALFVREKGKIIRLSLPMTQVKKIENDVVALFVLVIYLSPLLAVVLAFFFVKRAAVESGSR